MNLSRNGNSQKGSVFVLFYFCRGLFSVPFSLSKLFCLISLISNANNEFWLGLLQLISFIGRNNQFLSLLEQGLVG